MLVFVVRIDLFADFDFICYISSFLQDLFWSRVFWGISHKAIFITFFVLQRASYLIYIPFSFYFFLEEFKLSWVADFCLIFFYGDKSTCLGDFLGIWLRVLEVSDWKKKENKNARASERSHTESRAT